MQPSSEGRHRARHSANPGDAGPERARVRPRSTAKAWYRWFAVFGLVALIGVVLAYRSKNPHAELTASNGGAAPRLGSSILSRPEFASDTAALGKMPIVRVYYNGDHQYPTLRLTDRSSMAVRRSFVAVSRADKLTPDPTVSPIPSPSLSPRPSGSPPPGVQLVGLALKPPSVSLSAEVSAMLTIRMSQRANVTVCLLDAGGRIVRTVFKPATPAGQVTVSYLRHLRPSHRLPAGFYSVLVVASNAHGSAARSATLTVTTR